MTACLAGEIELFKTQVEGADRSELLGIFQHALNQHTNGGAEIEILLNSPHMWPPKLCSYVLLKVTSFGYVGSVKKLLALPYLCLSQDTAATLLEEASTNGHVEVVSELLRDPRISPSCHTNTAFIAACQKGHLEVVKLLLADPRISPQGFFNEPIKKASENGHTEVVRLLLKDPRVDPSSTKNYAVRWASYGGHAETVKLLLTDPRVDPTVDNNNPLCLSTKLGFYDVVDALLDDDRVSISGSGALFWACKVSKLHILKRLLNDRRSISRTDIDYALREALQNKKFDVLTVMLLSEKVLPSLGASLLLLQVKNSWPRTFNSKILE